MQEVHQQSNMKPCSKGWEDRCQTANTTKAAECLCKCDGDNHGSKSNQKICLNPTGNEQDLKQEMTRL